MGDSPSPRTSRKPSPSKSQQRLSSPRESVCPRNSSELLDFLDTVQIGEIIGHGSFGKVFVAVDLTTKEQYAIKKVHLDHLEPQNYDLVQIEVTNMNGLNNRGLLKLKSALTWTTFCMLITPLMTHRSCSDIIRMAYPTGLPENAVGLILKDILNALNYLHKRNIIHRTIKASHILISGTGAAILTGFRYMLQIPPNKTHVTTVNTAFSEMARYLNWTSPEMLMQDSSGFGLNSDMYSVGITACELANGVVPYSDISPSGILVKKMEEAPPKLWDKNFLPSQEGVTPPYLSEVTAGVLKNSSDQPYKRKSFSVNFRNFVSICVVPTPNCRTTCEQAQKSKFITPYSKESPTELLKHLPLLGPPLQFKPQPDELAQAVAQSSQEGEEWDFSTQEEKTEPHLAKTEASYSKD